MPQRASRSSHGPPSARQQRPAQRVTPEAGPAAQHAAHGDAAQLKDANVALQLQATAGNRALQRLVQRQAAQREGDPNLFNVPDVNLPAPGGGQALPETVQAKMEGALNADFSGVRVHESSYPSQVGAIAYTQGEDIHMEPGLYKPESPQGRETLGHELAHVVQQREGRVASPQGEGAPVNADPSLEREADELGRRAANS